MKTLTLNLDDQLYDEITRNVGDIQYIKQMLQNYLGNLVQTKSANSDIETPKKISKVTGTTMTLQEMAEQNPMPSPFTDSICGILKDFDDGRDYKEMINEVRDEKMARYL